MIVPIAAILFVVTLVISSKTYRYRYMQAMIPFVAACALSIPIFPPEIPHGNLMFVAGTWFCFCIVTTWIHDLEVVSPAASNPKPVTEAQIEYIKEQTAIWKAGAFGLLAIYLAALVTSIKELHEFNAKVVLDKREVWFLDSYTNLEMMIFTGFMLIGPIYEAARKIMKTNQLLLTVSNGSISSNADCDRR